MITGALTVTTAPATWRSFRLAVPALLLGLGLLGLLFREEIEAAVHVWMHSTASNHCILLLPIAAYLAWIAARCSPMFSYNRRLCSRSPAYLSRLSG